MKKKLIIEDIKINKKSNQKYIKKITKEHGKLQRKGKTEFDIVSHDYFKKLIKIDNDNKLKLRKESKLRNAKELVHIAELKEDSALEMERLKSEEKDEKENIKYKKKKLKIKFY